MHAYIIDLSDTERKGDDGRMNSHTDTTESKAVARLKLPDTPGG